MAQFGEVKGTVLLEGSPVVRQLVAVSYKPFDVPGSDPVVQARQVVGAAVSAADGTYTLNTIEDFTDEVIVVALDDYGEEWRPFYSYSVGNRIRPTSGNETGYVYVCTVAGTSAAQEPVWWDDDGTAEDSVGSAMFEAVPSWWPVAHAPIAPTVKGTETTVYPLEVDPHWEDVLVLFHGETFDDSGPLARTDFNIHGNTSILTAESKFGTSSFYFDGNGDYIEFPNEPDFAFGTGDFTVEAFVFCQSGAPGGGSNNDRGIFGSLDVTPFFCFLKNDDHALGFWDGTTQRNGSIPLSLQQWHHVAWTRRRGVLRMFVDGVKAGEWTSHNINFNSVVDRRIGSNGTSRHFHGYIDEFRITNVGRYVEDFIVPEEAYPESRFAPGRVPTILDPDFDKIVSRIHADEGVGNFDDGFDQYYNYWRFDEGDSVVSAGQTVFNSDASVYMDGVNSGIYCHRLDENGSRLIPENGDSWTFECWVYPLSISGTRGIVSQYAGSDSDRFLLQLRNDGVPYAFHANGASGGGHATGNGVNALVPNQWQHIAICFDSASGLLRWYTDGGLEFEQDFSGISAVAAHWGTIGARRDGGSYSDHFHGYFDEIRITHGVARHSGQTIEVPTGPYRDLDYDPLENIFTGDIEPEFADEFIDDVKMILRFDDGDGALEVYDEIRGEVVGNINNGGNQATTESSNVKHGTQSLEITQSGEYFYVGDVGEVDFKQDITVEAWFRFTTFTDPRALFHHGIAGDDSNRFQIAVPTNGSINLVVNDNGTIIGQASSPVGVVTLGNWHHIALVKDNLDVRVYVDGVKQIEETLDANWEALGGGESFRIGYGRYGGSARYLFGWVDDFRHTARARYDEDFTPPTETYPLTKYTPATEPYFLDDYYDLTDSVLNLNNSVANTGAGLSTWNLNGTAFLEDSKFGSHSMLVGDDQSYMNSADIPDFGTDDFCFECWVKGSNTVNNRFLVDNRGPGYDSTQSFVLYEQSGGESVDFWYDGAVHIVGNRPIRDNKWHHIALCRQGEWIVLYIDGYYEGRHYSATPVNLVNGLHGLVVGAHSSTSTFNQGWNGQIDDVRITIGHPRYVGAFIPPVIEHADRAISNRITDVAILNWTNNVVDNPRIIGDPDKPGWTIEQVNGSNSLDGWIGGTNNETATISQKIPVPEDAVAFFWGGRAYNRYTHDEDSGAGRVYFYDAAGNWITSGGATIHTHEGTNFPEAHHDDRHTVTLVPAGAKYVNLNVKAQRSTDGGQYNHGSIKAVGLQWLRQTGDAFTVTPLTIINHSFESGLSGWTTLSGSGEGTHSSAGVGGGVGFWANNTAGAVVYQDIDLPPGDYDLVNFRAMLRTWYRNRDHGFAIVRFKTLNGTDLADTGQTIITRGVTGSMPQNFLQRIPPGTERIRVELHVVREDGTALQAGWDEIYIDLISDPNGLLADATGIE